MEPVYRKKRSANFTNNDKLLLINIVSKFKSIIDNKRTDAVTIKEKYETWKNITQEFNNSDPSCLRDVECLKKCYENRKKLLRKSMADQRRELSKTGSGLPDSEKKRPGDDVLLSIVRGNVLKGLDNHIDGDTVQLSTNLPQTNLLPEIEEDTDHLKIIYETDDNETSLMELNMADNVHVKCEPSNLNEETDAPDATSCNFELHRRRPRTIVKSLTSELSEKYNKLLDERLEIAQYQKKHLQNLIQMEKVEHELRVELLKTQIEKEKK